MRAARRVPRLQRCGGLVGAAGVARRRRTRPSPPLVQSPPDDPTTARKVSLMPPAPKSAPLLPLAPALAAAERGGYALGSFAPRYTAMIRPVLRAGQRTRSPLIVQISQRELERYGITPAGFAEAFF